MKKILFFLLVSVALSSCKTSSTLASFQGFLDKHNFQETHYVNPTTGQTTFTASIDSLYDYSKVAEVCDTAVICVNISRARVNIQADCSNGGKTVLETLYSLWKKINFFK